MKRILYCFCLVVLFSPAYAQSVDSSFVSPKTFRPALIKEILPAANGKVYVLGDIEFSGDRSVSQLVRLTPSGYLDTSFKPELPSGWNVFSAEVLPSGNVVVIVERSNRATTVREIYVLAVNGRRLKHLVPPIGDPGCVKALPDNRFLVGGFRGVCRYTKNFNIDNTYIPIIDASGPIDDIQLQGDNILICGDFDFIGYQNPEYSRYVDQIARLSADGVLDTTFIDGAKVGGAISKMQVQRDGKIYPMGYFSSQVRFNADGSLDDTFNYPYSGKSIFVSDTSLIIQSENLIERIFPDGSIDSTFHSVHTGPGNVLAHVFDQSFLLANFLDVRFGIVKMTSAGVLSDTYKAQLLRNGVINSMDVDGTSVLVAGDFIKINTTYSYHTARLTRDGLVDGSFVMSNNTGAVHQVTALPDGALIAGSSKFVKVNRKGRLDASFQFNPIHDLDHVIKFRIQDDGRIIAGGTKKNIYRLHANGSYDSTFNTGAGPCCFFYDHNDFDFDLDRTTGKVIYAGPFDYFNDEEHKMIVRLNEDGSVDPTFNAGGMGGDGWSVKSVNVLNNGDIVISGYVFAYNGSDIPAGLFVVNADGTLDEEFLSNYTPGSLHSPEIVGTWGDQILLAENDYYSGFQSLVVNHSGVRTSALPFPPSVSVSELGNYFSVDDTELYVMGSAVVNGSDVNSLFRIVQQPSEALLARTSESSDEIVFYPNPVNDFVHINNAPGATVSIYDLSGTRSVTAVVQNASNDIDLRDLPRGRYVIAIRSGKTTYKKHFVKN